MLGLQGVKGTLDAGADADLVVLSEEDAGGFHRLVLDEVWKFGRRVFRAEENSHVKTGI
jgi:N-acetylglucosamine-6-phosphate deacetylase